MEDEDLAPNMYIKLIQSVWTESSTSTLYSSIVYRHDFLTIPTGSAVCIWRNILVFHFVGPSKYNFGINGTNYSLAGIKEW